MNEKNEKTAKLMMEKKDDWYDSLNLQTKVNTIKWYLWIDVLQDLVLYLVK
jgi:hypothetical protein